MRKKPSEHFLHKSTFCAPVDAKTLAYSQIFTLKCKYQGNQSPEKLTYFNCNSANHYTLHNCSKIYSMRRWPLQMSIYWFCYFFGRNSTFKFAILIVRCCDDFKVGNIQHFYFQIFEVERFYSSIVNLVELYVF